MAKKINKAPPREESKVSYAELFKLWKAFGKPGDGPSKSDVEAVRLFTCAPSDVQSAILSILRAAKPLWQKKAPHKSRRRT